MKLIVGFGNPGNNYNFTRHNFGFLALDFYAKVKNLSWESAPKFNAIYLKTTPAELNLTRKSSSAKRVSATKLDSTKKAPSVNPNSTKSSSFDPNEPIYLIKPQAFYNLSGVPTQNFAHFFKITLENLLVLCDDFNLEFGATRFREKGTDGGNNGLKSCIKELGTTNFARLRLGTGNNSLRHRIGDTDFVLGKFTPEEREKLPEILRDVSQKIDEFLS